MKTNRLTGRQRLAVAGGALGTLVATGMAQCPLLSVDNTLRAALTLASGVLSLLCVSILLEDMLVRPLMTRGLHALRRQRSLLTR